MRGDCNIYLNFCRRGPSLPVEGKDLAKPMKRYLPEPGAGTLSMAAVAVTSGLGTISTQADESLEALLIRSQAGDGDAFGCIVARFERMVHGQILRMTRDQEVSDDLSQDVFLQLWKVLPAITTSASLAGWLKKVSVNSVISYWRSRESQRRRIEAMVEAFPRVEEPCPVARLIDEEDRDRVRSALELIPSELRVIITLRVYENLSYDDLAELLGLELGTVRSRLFRARQMIKEILQRWEQAGRRSNQIQ